MSRDEDSGHVSKIGSDSIRDTFLDFFEEHSHFRIGGAPVVPDGDPTLLFVNSGMAPLKKYFTGERKPPHADLCNVQACIRTRDIDDVGDRHHLTFFEMLGSWSIGNYFKERAVELAYELLVGRFGLDPKRLYATVFAGDAQLGLPPDEVSAAVWERVGIARDHIVALPAADNFWGPAGGSGPCGPCTEVFLDTGEEFGPGYVPGGEFDTTRRYIEIWNAGVFMEFDKGLDGAFTRLPFTSVDTGSGLERMELALNGLSDVYESDLLAPTVAAVRDVFGEHGPVEQHHRLIADHMRAATLILSDGVRPGNEGRGYIPRRLIRKCVAVALGHGHERFAFEPVLESVIHRMGPHYPRFVSDKDEIFAAVQAECADFGRTVRRGLDRLDTLISRTNELNGADAFHLFTTYGLPVEIARDLAVERGATVSLDDFQSEFRRHQTASRGDGAADGAPRNLRVDDVLPAALASVPPTEFVGGEELEAEAYVRALFVNGALVEEVGAAGPIDLVVDRTPFYGEDGGQVGDVGSVRGASGSARVVTTLTHASGRSLHRLELEEGVLRVGERLVMTVDPGTRLRTAANHSATHLLNAALRQVLGAHVGQAGSLVEPERLRFDFTHTASVAPDQLAAVERLVNQWILADSERRVRTTTPAEAIARGAVSLPGEDYGEIVRVVEFPPFSMELCGGTHVPRTSVLGSFRITSEQSVASGVRRINAVTRDGAVEHALEHTAMLRAVSEALQTNPRDAASAARRLSERAHRKNSAPPAAGAPLAGRGATAMAGDVPVFVLEVDVEPSELRGHALGLAASEDKVVLLWSTADSGRATLVLSVPDRLVTDVPADVVLRQLVGRLGGSGGGSGKVAQGGVSVLPETARISQLLVESIPSL
jgi:alanyl-tRNA synthetase